MNRPVVFSLPDDLLNLIDKVKEERMDPTRSATVRVLLLRGLASLTYLPPEKRKALGCPE